jgi:hypothetical protein
VDAIRAPDRVGRIKGGSAEQPTRQPHSADTMPLTCGYAEVEGQ